MSTQGYPAGWSESRVRKLLKYYESQSDGEAGAEIEAAPETTTIEVPTALLLAVREFIEELKASQKKNSEATVPEPSRRTKQKSKPRRPTRLSRE